jgi:ribosomal protein S12 methylthiotransferase
MKIMIDREEEEYYVGRTEFDSPEIDNEVLIPKESKNLEIGCFYQALITAADNFDLYAEIED